MKEKIKKLIKNNYKTIIFFIILGFLYTYKLDYLVYTYGKPIDLDKKISVENSYETYGKMYLTYVEARGGLIPVLLLAKLLPSWDIVPLDNMQIQTESEEEIMTRNRLDLELVNDYAIKNAFEMANIPYEEENKEVVIYYVFDEADTTLQVGDYVKKINNVIINSEKDFVDNVNKYNEGDILNIEVIRSGKTINTIGEVLLVDNTKIIGVYLRTKVSVKPSIEVDIDIDSSEGGPSGGLMSALYIYNKIIKEDITHGKKIAGTGTITYEGEVGAIGGVKYKLKGAVKSGADIFIVPTDNLEEVNNLVKENNYNITIIDGSTFEEVIKKLNTTSL